MLFKTFWPLKAIVEIFFNSLIQLRFDLFTIDGWKNNLPSASRNKLICTVHLQILPCKNSYNFSCFTPTVAKTAVEGVFPNPKQVQNLWKPSLLYLSDQPNLCLTCLLTRTNTHCKQLTRYKIIFRLLTHPKRFLEKKFGITTAMRIIYAWIISSTRFP